MKKTFLASLSAVIVVVAIALVAGSAHAVPISGDVSFTGTFAVDNPADLSLATKVVSFSGVTVTPEATVNNGDYEGTDGSVTTFKPFTFTDVGVDPLWTFNFNGKTYSFTATTVGVSFQNKDTLVVEGVGTAHITGFDDTPGFWNITANHARASFSFSSSASSLVPEPASVGVAALGLATLLFRRRRAA